MKLFFFFRELFFGYFHSNWRQDGLKTRGFALFFSLPTRALTLSLPNVTKGKFRPNLQISFSKILKNK